MAHALFVLAALVATSQPTRMPPRAEATVSVRVMVAARIHLGAAERRMIPAAVHIEGERRPAMLVEFQ